MLRDLERLKAYLAKSSDYPKRNLSIFIFKPMQLEAAHFTRKVIHGSTYLCGKRGSFFYIFKYPLYYSRAGREHSTIESINCNVNIIAHNILLLVVTNQKPAKEPGKPVGWFRLLAFY